MQSTMTGNPYAECMASCGEWAQTWNLTSEQRATAVNAYNEFYGIYLQTRSGAVVPGGARSSSTTQGQPRTQRPRQGTGAATTRKVTTGTGARVRTAPGQVGVVDAKVLDVIIKNPGITTERLLGRAALKDSTTGKDMTANILGTCLGRLFKKNGYITGTEKVGPFTATQAGIAARQKQPTSIGQARQARQARAGRGRGATTPAATEQTAATG